jgi:8-oxo-dGTP pyrophosphatase MutT (NUDIX family)
MADLFNLGIKALIRNQKGEILLLQVNPDMLNGNNMGAYWDIPGGRIEKGDSIEGTLIRELYEECGITDFRITGDLGFVISNIRIPVDDGGDIGLILAVYLCKVNDKQPIKISNEHQDYKYFAPKDAGELLRVKYPKEIADKIGDLG